MRIQKKTTMPVMRTLKNRDLEGTNIKPFRSNGTIYYYYIMPDGSRESLGKDRKKAIEASIILNQHLRGSGSLADQILNKKPQEIGEEFNKVANEFIDIFLPEKGYSKNTLQEKIYQLQTHREKWRGRSISSIKTTEIAKFLNSLPNNSYVKHQTVLSHLFSFAIHQGYTETNPVLVTLKKKPQKRVRKRHTKEGIKAIYDISPDWLKRAINIALLSLQRRSDLTSIHANNIDMEKRTIEILQDKSRNYPKPVYLSIIMGDDLLEAVQSCLKSDIPCPYLIHYRPEKMPKRGTKSHPFSVTNGHLTKEFTKYRDLSGAYDHLKKNQRPTLHDLRALGAYLYKKAGYQDEYIQALTGHASLEMLEHYYEGHEDVKPVIVHADLSDITKTKSKK